MVGAMSTEPNQPIGKTKSTQTSAGKPPREVGLLMQLSFFDIETTAVPPEDDEPCDG